MAEQWSNASKDKIRGPIGPSRVAVIPKFTWCFCSELSPFFIVQTSLGNNQQLLVMYGFSKVPRIFVCYTVVPWLLCNIATWPVFLGQNSGARNSSIKQILKYDKKPQSFVKSVWQPGSQSFNLRQKLANLGFLKRNFTINDQFFSIASLYLYFIKNQGFYASCVIQNLAL